MSHMLPPDDERDYSTPSDIPPKEPKSLKIEFFTRIVILMGIIILIILVKSYLSKEVVEKEGMYKDPLIDTATGSALGGAGSGAINMDDDEMPNPESIAREMQQQGGGTMKVFVSSPSGDRVIEVPAGGTATSKPIGGDTTEATPVGGAGGGK